jgi:hypothetical protein
MLACSGFPRSTTTEHVIEFQPPSFISLINVVERAVGVLKMKWHILVATTL